MLKFTFLMIGCFCLLGLQAQKKLLYNPAANGAADIEAAIQQAAAQGKHVLIQAGGNWCRWCLEFDRFCKADSQIVQLRDKNFVVVHLNWSKENENKTIFARYRYPQRFGFPVFVVLDGQGQQIHTQDSEYLEDGKESYLKKKVLSFLINWTPSSLAAPSQ
jgi:thiol:disulfide interchange protein